MTPLTFSIDTWEENIHQETSLPEMQQMELDVEHVIVHAVYFGERDQVFR